MQLMTAINYRFREKLIRPCREATNTSSAFMLNKILIDNVRRKVQGFLWHLLVTRKSDSH